MFAIAFPAIDPIALELGPIVIRWYSLAYIFGFFLGFHYICYLIKFPGQTLNQQHCEDLFFFLVLSVVLGARLGYVVFYGFDYYLAHPIEIFKIWNGGMSFHGGLLGVIFTVLIYSRYRKINMWGLGDLLCCVAPIGLFLGRLANFINAELYGRVTQWPMGIVFPSDPLGLPRHPSQLYEAFFEGIVLFMILYFCFRRDFIRRHCGILTGLFFTLYGVFRFIIEFFREPDPWTLLPLFQMFGMTFGQFLCVLMIVPGLLILYMAWNKKLSMN